MSGGGNSVASMGGPAQGGPVNPKASMLVDPYRGTAGTAPQFGRGVSYGALPQGVTAGQVVRGPNDQMGKWSAGGNFHPQMQGGIDGGMGGAAITRGMNTGQPIQQPYTGTGGIQLDAGIGDGTAAGPGMTPEKFQQTYGRPMGSPFQAAGGKGGGGMDALMQLFSRMR
jgi:hypothetical protein